MVFQRQRHGAFLQFFLRLVDTCQRHQMLPVPAAAIHLHKSGIGQQIDGTFKEVNGIAARCRDAEREPFVATAGIAHKIRPQTSQVGVPGLVIPVQPDENRIVMGRAFIQPPRLNAEINEFGINAAAAKLGVDTAGAGTGLGQQQNLWLL